MSTLDMPHACACAQARALHTQPIIGLTRQGPVKAQRHIQWHHGTLSEALLQHTDKEGQVFACGVAFVYTWCLLRQVELLIQQLQITCRAVPSLIDRTSSFWRVGLLYIVFVL